MADLGIETFSNEPAPPSEHGKTAIEILGTMLFSSANTSYETRVNAAKAYALLDLADAIRNS